VATHALLRNLTYLLVGLRKYYVSRKRPQKELLIYGYSFALTKAVRDNDCLLEFFRTHSLTHSTDFMYIKPYLLSYLLTP